MKMSELEQRTGAQREAIRVYFRKGLLPPPKKLKSNVSEYGEEHVRGIQTIRSLLSEKRLSLDEIGRALASHDATVPVDAATIRHLDELLAARLGADDSLVPLASVKERNPKAETDAKAMHKVGAIELVTRNGARYLSRVDAQIVGIWGDMRAAGFTEKEGFSADLAEIYVQRADDLAQAEIAAFMERVSKFSDEKKAEWAQAGLTSMLALFSMLRMKAAIKAIKANGL
tara:strand:- start:17100 stop:17786 length:687 start_codon:yes stop_codon:yes gene_type:complete